MMTAEDRALEARLARAREFEFEVNGVTFGLVIPQRQTVRATYAELEGKSYVSKMSDTLAGALLWVRGATERDIGLDSDAPLPATAYAARAYVAEHPDTADALVVELYRRMQERYATIEDDRKNSPGASPSI